VIPLACRTKGGAAQLGARLPGELGPFGIRDDDQADGEVFPGSRKTPSDQGDGEQHDDDQDDDLDEDQLLDDHHDDEEHDLARHNQPQP
jgi:hypothetical protein